MFTVAVVIQQPPAPRAAVVHGDSGTVAVWSEGDTTWVYTASARANGVTAADASSLPHVVDSAKALHDPPLRGAATVPNVFFNFQVEHQASDMDSAGTEPAWYLDQLRAERASGSTGKPIIGSFEVIHGASAFHAGGLLRAGQYAVSAGPGARPSGRGVGATDARLWPAYSNHYRRSTG